MKRIFQAFLTITGLLLISDIFLLLLFSIDYWIEGTTQPFKYLLWINIYTILFGTILGSLNNKVIYKRLLLFFIVTLLIFIISSYFVNSFNKLREHFYYALISLLISFKLSSIISLLNSNLKEGIKKVKSVKIIKK